MNPTASIQIEHLSKKYRQKNGTLIQAVNDLSLEISPGQVFGFLGPNGAGKTTTIKMICALVKPTSGSAHVGGFDCWNERNRVMQLVGAVLEGTRNVYWTLSTWDNLIYFGNLKGLTGRPLATRAESLLKDLDLWDRRKDLVRTFSRGMQQKVAIACALIADPPVLLLDEPTLGLDVQAARAVKNLILRLVKETQKTIVLTTHQLDMAEEICDRVAIIRKGSLIANHSTSELLQLFQEELYHFRIEGSLPLSAQAQFSQYTVSIENGITTLSGLVLDQDELFTIIEKIRELELPFLGFERAEPDLEEIFIRYLEETPSNQRGLPS